MAMTPADATLDLARVRDARRAIGGIAVPTPAIPALGLVEHTGGDPWLKLESTQPTGAFKLRGAACAVTRLAAAGHPGPVVCASTGNHGRAVAYAARRQGMRAVVCLSSLVPAGKVAAIEALGAEVRRVGASQDEAQREVDRLVEEAGMAEIPPFDHPDVIAGQGTIGLELLEQVPAPAAVLVPLSGGGLLGGIALAVKSLAPEVRMIGVSMARGGAMHASLVAGHPVEVEEPASLADCLGGGIGLDNRWTFELCRRHIDAVALLEEREVYRAMRVLFERSKLVTEGAGAAAVAAILAGKVALPEGPAVAIVSGSNVDSETFLDVVQGRAVRIGDQEVTP